MPGVRPTQQILQQSHRQQHIFSLTPHGPKKTAKAQPKHQQLATLPRSQQNEKNCHSSALPPENLQISTAGSFDMTPETLPMATQPTQVPTKNNSQKNQKRNARGPPSTANLTIISPPTPHLLPHPARTRKKSPRPSPKNSNSRPSLDHSRPKKNAIAQPCPQK